MKLLNSFFLFAHAILAQKPSDSETTTAAELTCQPILELQTWNLQGCQVDNVSAITVKDLGYIRPFTNFKKCKIECGEDGDFTIDAESMEVCDRGLNDTGFTKEG